MPKITDPELLLECTKCAARAKEQKRNLQKTDVAIIIVRTLIAKLVKEGALDADMLGDEYRKLRSELVELMKPLGQASNNVQNTMFVPSGLLEKVSGEKDTAEYDC